MTTLDRSIIIQRLRALIEILEARGQTYSAGTASMAIDALAPPPQPVEVTEEMVERAMAYNNGTGWGEEDIGPRVMRGILEAALFRPSGDGIRAGRAEVIEE